MNRILLLIDDDPDDAFLFAQALGQTDASVRYQWAREGRSALEGLSDGEIEKPDLIFLDLNLPLISGWQVLDQLRSQADYASTPVIIYSTSSDRADSERALRLGATAFYTKPDDYEQLQQMLRHILEAYPP